MVVKNVQCAGGRWQVGGAGMKWNEEYRKGNEMVGYGWAGYGEDPVPGSQEWLFIFKAERKAEGFQEGEGQGQGEGCC